MMAVNRDGFLSFCPWDRGQGIALYRFSGGDFRRYTIGAFVLFDNNPAALLYRDDRFWDSAEPLPSPRWLTFDRSSPALQAAAVPAPDAFSPADGWDIDALRQGADGNWYFRAVRKNGAQPDIRPDIRMLRSVDLVQEGEKVSLGAFQSAALPLPVSAAPEPLGSMLAAVFADGDYTAGNYAAAAVVSPEFTSARLFAADRESAGMAGFYSGAAHQDWAAPFLLMTTPQGNCIYIEKNVIRRFSLPPLPHGFVYTWIGMTGDTIIASWEEQEGYSIGAAGFMVIKDQ
jgi:hypothetical protein